MAMKYNIEWEQIEWEQFGWDGNEIEDVSIIDICFLFLVVIDTNQWYHATYIHPGEVSITIGSEYDWIDLSCSIKLLFF